jgi:hypothetical protein
MEVSGQFHAPAALPSEKKPLLPIGKEDGWAPEPVWTWLRRGKFPFSAGIRTTVHQARSGGEEKKSLPLAGNRNPVVQ